jgi:hypothetical protein
MYFSPIDYHYKHFMTLDGFWYFQIFILLYVLCTATLTESFPCFFLSCKANARVNPAKTGHGPHSSYVLCCSVYFLCCFIYFCVVLCIVCFVSFSELFVCNCVLYYCYRLPTQLLLNISYLNYPSFVYYLSEESSAVGRNISLRMNVLLM